MTRYPSQYAPPSLGPDASESSTRIDRLFAKLSGRFVRKLRPSITRSSYDLAMPPPHLRQAVQRAQRRFKIQSLFNLSNLLILMWMVLLYWGEALVFRSSVRSCQWNTWERWPPGSTPHHLLFVADPQLIDPHTYPGRPWPLSSFTMQHTDNYLRRSYTLLQGVLNPDTTFFLGDLFDGGREWETLVSKTSDTKSRFHASEARWKKYGESFWLREYERFGRIFFGNFAAGGYAAGRGQRGKKIIASLPGNHDLGLGLGIQLPVRERFEAFFGEGNRVDIIANHTFVSVDTVSLSAKGQVDPVTGSQGSGYGDGPASEKDKIWLPSQKFIDEVRKTKERAIDRELRYQAGLPPLSQRAHEVKNVEAKYLFSVDDSITADKAENNQRRDLSGVSASTVDLPTILLTHVPLYRPPETPCGPLREHWPPSPHPANQEPPQKDARNAILVQGGYQYQNVLTPEISSEIVEKVGNIAHVFSGDDHDYCELRHKSYTGIGGGVKEITVKSISWAMGVRTPGVVLLSLWNPIDGLGNPIGTRGSGHGASSAPASESGGSTIQSHLCLLPNQLSIFTRYLMMFLLTLIALGIRSLVISIGILKSSPSKDHTNEALFSLLPITQPPPSSDRSDKAVASSHAAASSAHSSISSTSSIGSARLTSSEHLASRSTAKRSPSPRGGYGYTPSPTSAATLSAPSISYTGTAAAEQSDQFGSSRCGFDHAYSKTSAKRATIVWGNAMSKLPATVREFGRDLRWIATVGFVWYFWLLYTV